MLTLERVASYRTRTYRTQPELRVTTREAAVDYVNARGFVMFWPIKGIEMPSLWAAVAGERSVADAHDDPGHVTWGWKDALLGARQWYYAKVLRRKATMISLDVVPAFYALSENFGSPEEDYLYQYRDGTMTAEAKTIYEALLNEGPLHTIALRRATAMTDTASSYRFNRGLEELQSDLKILPIGVAEAGTWNYAFVYECVHRHYPEILDRAREFTMGEAQRRLLSFYMRSVGAVAATDVAKVFWWPKREVGKTVDSLIRDGDLVGGLKVETQKGEWIALPELL
jgi:hypothetical protein